ncbi:hypothetical protein FSP39_021151 [Pinctada imbricata]|uniref:Sulfatase N-terminal domain-containing protein n=1 Tax=Pinctada imbricata TaxID=66713 RepID=A0AA88YP42_PINIB|nr:hypothetical protein FSP39_021151 [Pinctada imbricata]
MKTVSFLILVQLSSSTFGQIRPNILFIVADDLGWNDVGFRNPDMITPNIDKLAHSGIILNQSYVQPVCSPSRNSWMSGYYPFRSGLQHIVIRPAQPVCAPLNRTFLPQELKKLGYKTHMIGKWHLGFCNVACTPNLRGFDTFFGYYTDAEDYYTKMKGDGIDFHENFEKAKPDGEYSANQFAKRAQEIINNHNSSEPFFMYLPFQSVHEPIEVPKKYEDMYKHIKNKGRRQFSGMVSALDEAIGNITKTLEEQHLMQNTLILFTADNGGWIPYFGNNYPLRGGKITVFEGGTRATAFITGAGITYRNATYNGIIHAVDWMPTLIGAAGGGPTYDGMDGINQWIFIQTLSDSARSEFIYNLDDTPFPLTGKAAIRSGDYKLIEGYPGPYPNWYKPDTVYEGLYNKSLYEEQSISEVEFKMYADKVMLFNIAEDPTEHFDLSEKRPDIVKNLQARLDEYRKQMVKANYPPNDKNGDPKYYDGYWSPGWC